MPKRKPIGWPDYMEPKRSGGSVRYYWNAPTWARQRGCPVRSEALGGDFAAAKARCDLVLNPLFRSWRTGGTSDEDAARRVVVGSVDWCFAAYKKSPKYLKLAKPSDVDYALNLVAHHVLKDGRRFGELALKSIQPGTADRLYERLRFRDDGKRRDRAAQLAMVYAKRAWDVGRRDHPTIIPPLNPFAKMDFDYKAKPTKAATRQELKAFVNAADKTGRASIGTAAMVGFYWLQREEDIFTRLMWADYRPEASPDRVFIWHHKNRQERVPLPLYDEDGTELWPEMMARLESTPRRGPLVVMRDAPDHKSGVYLPWPTGGRNSMRYVQAAVRRICREAELSDDITFTSFRHGGHTEGADAELTDAQMRALGGHKTTAALLRYAKATERQRQVGARKRLEVRTKKGILSE